MSIALGYRNKGTKRYDPCPQGLYGRMKKNMGKPIIVLQQGYWLNGGLRQEETEQKGRIAHV